jgi:hypothetical protein
MLMLALGACARPPPLISSPVPGVAVRRTALPGYVEIVGPRKQHAPPFLGVRGTNFFVLRSWLDRRTGRATTQLYVSASYRGPERIWNAAYDPAGTALPFTAFGPQKDDRRDAAADPSSARRHRGGAAHEPGVSSRSCRRIESSGGRQRFGVRLEGTSGAAQAGSCRGMTAPLSGLVPDTCGLSTIAISSPPKASAIDATSSHAAATPRQLARLRAPLCDAFSGASRK